MQAGERCSSCWKDASAPDFRRQRSGSSMGGSCFGIRSVVEQQCSCQKQGMFSLARSAFCRGYKDPHGTPRDAKSIDVLLIQLHVMGDTVFLLPCFSISLRLHACLGRWAVMELLQAYRSKVHMFGKKDFLWLLLLVLLLLTARPRPLGDLSDLPAQRRRGEGSCGS